MRYRVGAAAVSVALATSFSISAIAVHGRPAAPHADAASPLPSATHSSTLPASRSEVRPYPGNTPSPSVSRTVKASKKPPTPVKTRAVVRIKPTPRHTSTPRPAYTPKANTSPKAYALSRVGAAQFRCLDALWMRESGWRWSAQNPSSGAYGIPQALPGSKMASAGSDWRTNPITQIRWGLGYIGSRYGTPCAAWAHSQANGWY